MFDTIRSAFSERLFGRSPGRAKIADLDALKTALAQESAHVAQSAAYNYLRARTGFLGPKLFNETAFLEAVEVTRWEAYGAVLADLLMIVEGAGRPFLPPGGAAAEWCNLFHQALAVYPPPSHREDGWLSLEQAFAARLTASAALPPAAPEQIAVSAGQTIFAQLPLHPDIRRLDEEMVVNTVRFRMLRSWESLKERLEWPSISTEIRHLPAAE